jgi:hypothetical protein
MGLKLALQFVLDIMGSHQIETKGDSLDVIRGVRDNSKDHSYFGLLITDYHRISSSLHFCMLKYVAKTANVVVATVLAAYLFLHDAFTIMCLARNIISQ